MHFVFLHNAAMFVIETHKLMGGAGLGLDTNSRNWIGSTTEANQWKIT